MTKIKVKIKNLQNELVTLRCIIVAIIVLRWFTLVHNFPEKDVCAINILHPIQFNVRSRHALRLGFDATG